MTFKETLNNIFRLKQSEPKQRKKTLSNTIIRQNIAPTEIEMQNLKIAVLQAQDVDSPDRTLLYSIYEQIAKDSHYLSQYRTALFTVQQSPFIIYQNKTENEDLKELFDKEWFTRFVKYVLDSEFWGHSLIELSNIIDNQFSKATLINRYHVIPEFGSVKIRFDDDIDSAIPYRPNLTNWQLLEVGDNFDLGLLEIIAREVIWKTYSKGDWSQFIEKYGMPLLSIRTDTQDPREIAKMQDFGENFGSAGYILAAKDDEIDIVQGRQGSGDSDLFNSFIAECKDAISMLVNGQTGTSDEKSYVGSAEVHERILNKYTLARLERIQRFVNDKLIPFLNYWGYNLNDVKFQYTDLLPKKDDDETKTEMSAVKKKGLTII